MKKIRLLIFTLLVCFLAVNIVNAATKLTCKYAVGHDTYEVEYAINGDVTVINKVYKSNDTVQLKDVTNVYKDWFKDAVTDDKNCKSEINVEGKGTLTLTSKLEANLGSSQCYNYKTETTCRLSGSNGKVACVWENNDAAPNGGFCNVDNLLYVGCGGASDIPMQGPAIISMAVNLLKIATPLILIFTSLITLLKAMSAGKEDEMKKAQSSLIKKIIAAALVFFVVSIVQFIVSIVADDETDYNNFTNCLDCFLNNKCEKSTYYKTVVGGIDMCTPLTTGIPDFCSASDSDSNDLELNDYQTSCNGKYFSNGYQPKSIKSGGVCIELVDSNKDINVQKSDGSTVSQTIWKAGQACYYWNGEERTYVRVACNATQVKN
ncbi:MAG: hypothetical protein IKL65_05735 [Bacilli bacterium]|nr:hypothetical protein [Bacilli bacterium]